MQQPPARDSCSLGGSAGVGAPRQRGLVADPTLQLWLTLVFMSLGWILSKVGRKQQEGLPA